MSYTSTSTWSSPIDEPVLPGPSRQPICLPAEEQAMLRSCLAALPSGDWDALLILADWYSEHGRDKLAEYVRLRHLVFIRKRLPRRQDEVLEELLASGEHRDLVSLVRMLCHDNVPTFNALPALLLASGLAAGGQ